MLGLCNQLREYINLFVQLVEKYNQYAIDDQRKIDMKDIIWQNNVSPKFGSARIKIPLYSTDQKYTVL